MIRPTETRRSGSAYGSGLKSTRSSAAKSAVEAPRPSASTRMAPSAKPGCRRHERQVNQASCRSASHHSAIQTRRIASRVCSGLPSRRRAAASSTRSCSARIATCASSSSRISSSDGRLRNQRPSRPSQHLSCESVPSAGPALIPLSAPPPGRRGRRRYAGLKTAIDEDERERDAARPIHDHGSSAST